MNLEEQLNRIDELKTDPHMSLLLLGIKGNMTLDNLSESLLDNFKSPEDPEWHEGDDESLRALKDYQDQLVVAYDLATIDFYQQACLAIGDFISIHDDDFFFDVFSAYGAGTKTLEDVLASFKAYAEEVDEIPEGKIMVKDGERIAYLSEEEFKQKFGEPY